MLPFLATELRLAVLSPLSITDLVAMSHVDKDHRSLSRDVVQRRVRNTMIPFLSRAALEHFWEHLADSRSVVGGLSALQICLGPVQRQESTYDLEIYCPSGATQIWVSFWKEQGYFDAKCEPAEIRYDLIHVSSITTMSNKINGPSVRVVESKEDSFVPALLSCDTTAHMNFFNKERVVCLYPKLLDLKRALIAHDYREISKPTKADLSKFNFTALTNMAFQSYPCRSSCPALDRSSKYWKGGVVFQSNDHFQSDYTVTENFTWHFHSFCWNPHCYAQWILED